MVLVQRRRRGPRDGQGVVGLHAGLRFRRGRQEDAEEAVQDGRGAQGDGQVFRGGPRGRQFEQEEGGEGQQEDEQEWLESKQQCGRVPECRQPLQAVWRHFRSGSF